MAIQNKYEHPQNKDVKAHKQNTFVTSQANTTLAQYLKDSTHDIHHRLHAHPLTSPLTSGTLTHSHYVTVLLAFARFYEALECQADAYQAHAQTFKKICKKECSHIKQDITLLEVKNNPLPRATLPNLFEDHNSALGMRYVIQGSHLGGQVIAKNLKRTLGLSHTTGAAFFSGEGKETLPQWRMFLTELSETCTDWETCSYAACQTFSLLEQWLWRAWHFQNETTQTQNVTQDTTNTIPAK